MVHNGTLHELNDLILKWYISQWSGDKTDAQLHKSGDTYG